MREEIGERREGERINFFKTKIIFSNFRRRNRLFKERELVSSKDEFHEKIYIFFKKIYSRDEFHEKKYIYFL